MIKKISIFLLVCFISISLLACNNNDKLMKELAASYPQNDTYYEIFVRSFADSDGDGIGDFNGITAKLPYLQELGVTGLWLMPINPSPSYHGYDVEDYYSVNADYGTMEDFENLVTEADNLGIKIMLDMVFNHTSNQNPWFLSALAGDAKYRSYYNFIDAGIDTSKITGSWGQNIWHSSANGKYCGYFSYTMPDLNLETPAVYDEIINISEFWIDKGVSGFRLDAVHHFFGENEFIDHATSYLDNIVFLREYSKDIHEYDPNFYIIGEVYEEQLYQVVGDYYGGIDSPIDFPVARLIRTSAQQNYNRRYVDQIEDIYDYYRKINKDFISAPFIVNHDMDRYASQVLGDMDTLKLSAEMLLTLPGDPIIYYGEELGMYGYKANGPDIWDETRRLPMLFGDEYTTDWLVSTNQTLIDVNNLNDNVENVQEQLLDPNSLLATYQAMLKLRNENIALRYGNSFSKYEDSTASLQGFYREFEYGKNHQKLLILHNFSEEAVDMIDYNGTIIYVSGLTALENVNEIPPRSTVIINLEVED